LQKESVINSIQINFAENQTQLFNRSPKIYYQYLLEYSDDNKTWKQLVDKTTNKTDIPHDYIQLSTPVKARYIRLTNYHVPDGTFALSGFRIFGNGQGKKPEAVSNFNILRTQTDKREVRIKWKKNIDATGFNIRYGTQKDKLYNNYEVLGTDSLTIRSLNSELKYYFVIDAFNENGVAKGNNIVMVN
jgi:xylan 1,4-beta-xylosidase